MKPVIHMTKKRNLFEELNNGLDALAAERVGKVTLRRTTLAAMPSPDIAPEELLALRNRLHLSRAVFARAIRTNPRTVESWEQGRSKPSTHAALLIRLVEKYPETLDHLQAV